jgi:hypothetical protein
MKITKRQLRKIIKEELAVLTKDTIKDEVMAVLSDEGGAAGLEPIQKALSDLENDDISLPEEPIEDIIGDVPGVKRHKDGDFVDTTKLESIASLRSLIGDLLTESPDQIVCPNCGHINDGSVDKCAKCGHSRQEGNWKRLDMNESKNQEHKMNLTENQLRKVIRKELLREMKDMQDLSIPIPIDDLEFHDDMNGAMQFPGVGFSYSVRPENFEAEKEKLKQKYGEDVKISVPNPAYPLSRKLHSTKFEKSQSRERQNFSRHQDMMRKRLGREPGLGT